MSSALAGVHDAFEPGFPLDMRPVESVHQSLQFTPHRINESRDIYPMVYILKVGIHSGAVIGVEVTTEDVVDCTHDRLSPQRS
jgi:hypothetical protein